MKAGLYSRVVELMSKLTELRGSPHMAGCDPHSDDAEAYVQGVRDEMIQGLESLGLTALPSGAPLKSVHNLSIADVPCVIYEPEMPEGASPPPVVVYFHGGGWATGTSAMYNGLLATVAYEAQAIVVSVEYRLAPKYRFPAGLHDCYNVTRFLATSGHTIGLDTTRMVIAGDSAGGNLAAAVALRSQQEPEVHKAIAGQALLYPVIDATTQHASNTKYSDGYFLTLQNMVWFTNLYIEDASQALHPLVSPGRASRKALSHMPETLVMVAECDILRDAAEEMALTMKEEGVPTQLTRYNGTIHSFLLFPVEGKEEGTAEFVEFVKRIHAAGQTDSDAADDSAAEEEPVKEEPEEETQHGDEL